MRKRYYSNITEGDCHKSNVSLGCFKHRVSKLPTGLYFPFKHKRNENTHHKKALLSLTDTNKSKYYSAVHNYFKYFVTVILNSFSEPLFSYIKCHYFVFVLIVGIMFGPSSYWKFYLWPSLNLLAKAARFWVELFWYLWCHQSLSLWIVNHKPARKHQWFTSSGFSGALFVLFS